MHKNPIIIIDDDAEDLELISEAFKDLDTKNELLCFNKAGNALSYLKESAQPPLFILCDVNMDTINGFELRQILYDDEVLRLRTIPFLFLSTGSDGNDIKRAYDLSVQGYFKKPTSYEGIVTMLSCIMTYWGCCQHPNSKGLRYD